ncbi:MAG: maleylpyruvate isomerase N-terminal domain-containing protein [Actinomycetota bacterium]
MATRDELTAREAAAWEEFRTAVDAIPVDRRASPILTDGWSVKDVLWHIVYWWEDLTPEYASIRSGMPRVESEDTDTTNARVLDEGRELSLADVEAGVARSRSGMLATWADAPQDPRAEEWFIGETIEHYEEHLPWLRAVAE